VTAVSVIEHIGLGFYGDPLMELGQSNAMSEIKRILRRDGKLIMTVPFGEKNVSWYRTYDLTSLKQLLAGFDVKESMFITKEAGNWKPALIEQAKKAESEPKGGKSGVKAVALVIAQPIKEK
jgi:hypothetical protein